jgi:hypothetical protein
MYVTIRRDTMFVLSPQDENTLAHTLCIVIEYKTGSPPRESVFFIGLPQHDLDLLVESVPIQKILDSHALAPL